MSGFYGHQHLFFSPPIYHIYHTWHTYWEGSEDSKFDLHCGVINEPIGFWFNSRYLLATWQVCKESTPSSSAVIYARQNLFELLLPALPHPLGFSSALLFAPIILLTRGRLYAMLYLPLSELLLPVWLSAPGPGSQEELLSKLLQAMDPLTVAFINMN